MIKAGSLDRRISIERFGETENVYGDATSGFTKLADVWAQVIPGQGGERYANSENAATAPAVFIIRWSTTVADVNPKDRIRYAGRSYDIKRVEEINRREGLRIFAVAGAD